MSEIVFWVSTYKDRMGLGFTVWRAEFLTIVGHLVGVCLQWGFLGYVVGSRCLWALPEYVKMTLRVI